MTRRILLVSHAVRVDLQHLTVVAARMLRTWGIEAAIPHGDAAYHNLAGEELVVADPDDPTAGCELVVVLGGDGTILRGAELARPSGTPLLGINFGRVGFLAEAEREDLGATVERIAAADYTVEERLTLEVTALGPDRAVLARSWALNEATVEKQSRERMIELAVEIDARPVSTWGCDGVIVATPTGSTAYAFSAGGPIIWPQADTMLIVPLSAHALFARPLVVGPGSSIAVELVPGGTGEAVLWCDGRRAVELTARSRVEVRRGALPVRLARLGNEPFTDRLVEKFHLPIRGWRGVPRL